MPPGWGHEGKRAVRPEGGGRLFLWPPAGLADRLEGAGKARRLLLHAPSGRECGERAGARGLSPGRGWVGRPLWGRGAADEDRRLARGYSFQIKRISPRASQERFPGGFRISPRDPLETTKGEACGPLLWKPLGGWTGERGLRGTVGRGTGVRSGVLAAIQGVLPCGRRGWGRPGSSGADIGWLRALRGTRGRHAESSCPTGG